MSMNQECSRCKRSFDSSEDYEKHVKSNRCKEPYVCEPCDYITNRKSSYDNHIKTQKCKENHKTKEKEKKYACPHCKKPFRDNYVLSRHLNRKNPCYASAAVMITNNNNTVNNTNNTNNSNNTNNTMTNSNNRTIIINAHDPSAFLKDLNKVDKAIYNNMLQAYSINSPESIERMNEICETLPYKQPRIITKEKRPHYTEEELDMVNNEACRLSNNQYLSHLLKKSFFDTDDLEYTPFFRIPNSKKITVKYDNGLQELDYDIIQQLVSNIHHKMTLLEKEETICLHRIKKSIDEAYETIRSHFIKHIKNYKRL